MTQEKQDAQSEKEQLQDAATSADVFNAMQKNNETLNSIFKGIRPAVVALIIAPVLSTAKTAKINAKTVVIPIAVALLIFSGIPYISNPIVYIILGGLGGYIYYTWRLGKDAQGIKKKN